MIEFGKNPQVAVSFVHFATKFGDFIQSPTYTVIKGAILVEM